MRQRSVHDVTGAEGNWIRERIELPEPFRFSPTVKSQILARLIRAHYFEEFLQENWSSEKRFGLEGCESLVPGIMSMLDVGSTLGYGRGCMGAHACRHACVAGKRA